MLQSFSLCGFFALDLYEYFSLTIAFNSIIRRQKIPAALRFGERPVLLFNRYYYLNCFKNSFNGDIEVQLARNKKCRYSTGKTNLEQ